MMTANLDAIARLNECMDNDDSGGVLECLSGYVVDMSVYDSEAAAVILRALMKKLLEEHCEMLDNAELRSQWEICLQQVSNHSFSPIKFDMDLKTAAARAVMEHRQNAKDILTRLFNYICGGCVSLATPICSMNPEVIAFCEAMIMAADLFDNTDILEYEAQLYSQYAGADMRSGLWYLTACLTDREMFDPLDRLYKSCCGGDFTKLLNCCFSSNCQAKDNVFYIRHLYRRYVSGGKIQSDENARICSLIASSDYINNCFDSPRFFSSDGLADETLIREFTALSEIGFKTDNISMLLKYMNGREELEECVSRLMGDSPYFYLDELLHLLRMEGVNDLLENKNVYISIDDHSSPILLFDPSSCIFKEKWLKEKTKGFPIRITDPVRKNSYLNRVIENRASALNFLLKNVDFSLEQLTDLVELCIEYNNYNALNAVRKKIDEIKG